MTKTVLLASAAVLALSVSDASAKHAAPGAVVKSANVHRTVFKTPKGLKTLYDQTDNNTGVGIVSDDFDSGYFDSYDDQGADDFTVPSGHTWVVKEIDVQGVYFNGYGPADGVNLYFYSDNGGVPGKEVKSKNKGFTDDGFGNFSIKGKAKLPAGTYWVSVQAQMNFVGGAGEWGWYISGTQHGNPGMWQDPGGGFGVCASWAPVQSCIGYGPDWVFTLKGKDKT
jgi:hypothetical protein